MSHSSKYAIKGDIPEHCEIFSTSLSQLHNYTTVGMVIYLDFPNHERNGEDGLLILELLTIGLPYLLHLRDQSRT